MGADSHPPENYVKRGRTLYFNGFGIQYAGFDTTDLCIISTLDDEPRFDNLLDTIKNESGCDSVQKKKWISYDFVAIHWKDTNKIFDVLNILLKHGFTFQYFSKFKPSVILEDWPLTPEKIDAIYMRYIDKHLGRNLLNYLSCRDEQILDTWNWKTEEGKAYCLRLRHDLGLGDEKPEENYWNWPIFQNCDLNSLLDLDNSEPNPNLDIESDTTCLICMKNQPNTRVLPCDHCVVCKECSLKLENTNDKNTCVKCRKPITQVIYLDTKNK